LDAVYGGGEEMMMNRQELEQWLGAVDSTGLGFTELAEVLHLVLDPSRESIAIADAEDLRALRFTLAVLRDVFGNDADVRAWLAAPSLALDGSSPADLVSTGRIQELADLAVREWNRPRAAFRMKLPRTFASSVPAR
jgi:antitoxin Xre/MbcA/ParS-like protein